MKKHKANLFLEKFSLLNSQKHTEDINWSSSSSSDYEYTSGIDNGNLIKPRNRKRKRKKKSLKNISNLDITITDSSKDVKNDLYRDKSPILVTKCEIPVSPILVTKCPPNKPSSPILPNKSLHLKSPILILKNASPKYSTRVKKNLFYNKQQSKEQFTEEIVNFNSCDDKSRVEKNVNLFYINNRRNSNEESFESQISTGKTSELINSQKILEHHDSTQSAKINLIKKVKNYFDSHFSSENTSQNISDTPTPEECIKHEEIDILSCKTQMNSSIQQIKQESKSNSDSSNYFEKNTKKVKYKKGGLAHRLNVHLKKQNAHVSLWQHERFLAGNSNFVIPKGEHVMFYIKKIHFKYGCYLFEVVNMKYENVVIFINSLNVNINISAESVFKLYEPYRILELDNNYKIIVNVCKFECIDLKQLP